MATCGNTILKNLGPVWPRLMRLELAAAYVAMNVGPFMARPELAALVIDFQGVKCVDRVDLDAFVDAEKNKSKEMAK